MRIHVSVCSASLGIWIFTQNGQPTGVHISCNFVSVRAPKSDNFYLGLRSTVFAFSSFPATFSHYSVYRSFTWHYSRRITLGNNPPPLPPTWRLLRKKYCKWTHFVQLCIFHNCGATTGGPRSIADDWEVRAHSSCSIIRPKITVRLSANKITHCEHIFCYVRRQTVQRISCVPLLLILSVIGFNKCLMIIVYSRSVNKFCSYSFLLFVYLFVYCVEIRR